MEQLESWSWCLVVSTENIEMLLDKIRNEQNYEMKKDLWYKSVAHSHRA